MDYTKIWEWLQVNAVSVGLKIIIGILIIIIGFWIAAKIAKMINRQLEKSEITVSLRIFLSKVISVILKVLVVLVAMTTVGIQTAAFIALLGGIAIGVGMALQGSLSNLAGGLLILLFKPFRVGDTIESLDSTGEVKEISILQTVLLTPDRKTVILPNGSVFNNPIINYSREGIRRVDIGIGIAYGDDFEKAKELLLGVLKKEENLLEDKGYTVEIAEFGDNSVNLAMNGYCKTENFLKTKFNLNSATKKALDENGFSIPFPQQDIYVHTVNKN